MSHFDFELVIKIGSMALIREEDNDLNYNIISRLAGELHPGHILISSGAVEIGRIDYMKRNGYELKGDMEEIKTDYSSQGQTILMGLYRDFVPSRYSVRQVLVEHNHFNDPERADHIKRLLYRAANQNAIPIINYNDAVSNEESRRFELAKFVEEGRKVEECVDNDETAAVVAKLVRAEKLLLLTSVEGIYRDPSDSSTIIDEVTGANIDEITSKLDEMMSYCKGSSRVGTEGASAKLRYSRQALEAGSTVIIAHARHRVSDILSGKVRCTRISMK